MKFRAWGLGLAALLAAFSAHAAVSRVPAEIVASRTQPLDPGPSACALHLAAIIAYPGIPDALAPLREGKILEVGAGAQALLVKHMIGSLGFSPEKTYAIDPKLDAADSAVPAGNFRQIRAENLPTEWNGLFDNVVSFFTFSPEIVNGSTPGMGRGIDVAAAAGRIRAVLKPGGRAIIVTGGASGMNLATRKAFESRLIPKADHVGAVHVFEAPR